MVIKVKGWQCVSTFTARYRDKKGNSVSRSTMNSLVKKELAKPNSTDIDVMLIDTITLVKHKSERIKSITTAADIEIGYESQVLATTCKQAA